MIRSTTRLGEDRRRRRRRFSSVSPAWWQLVSNTIGYWSPILMAYADNDPVASDTNWVDAANPFIQGTAASKPANKIAGINGRPGYFLTTDDFMTCDGLAGVLAGTDVPFSFFGVMALQDVGAFCHMSLGNSGAASPLMHISRQVSPLRINIQRTDDAVVNKTQTSGLIAAGNYALAIIFDGTTVSVYSGDTSTVLIAAADMDVGISTFNRLTMGCLRRNTNTQFMTGHWGTRLLATGVKSGAQINSILSNMKAEYGL